MWLKSNIVKKYLVFKFDFIPHFSCFFFELVLLIFAFYFLFLASFGILEGFLLCSLNEDHSLTFNLDFASSMFLTL